MENGREKPLKSGAKRVDFFYRIVYNNNDAEMAERSNAHDSKSCDAGMYPRVQIPLSAPVNKRVSAFFGNPFFFSKLYHTIFCACHLKRGFIENLSASALLNSSRTCV